MTARRCLVREAVVWIQPDAFPWVCIVSWHQGEVRGGQASGRWGPREGHVVNGPVLRRDLVSMGA